MFKESGLLNLKDINAYLVEKFMDNVDHEKVLVLGPCFKVVNVLFFFFFKFLFENIEM